MVFNKYTNGIHQARFTGIVSGQNWARQAQVLGMSNMDFQGLWFATLYQAFGVEYPPSSTVPFGVYMCLPPAKVKQTALGCICGLDFEPIFQYPPLLSNIAEIPTRRKVFRGNIIYINEWCSIAMFDDRRVSHSLSVSRKGLEGGLRTALEDEGVWRRGKYSIYPSHPQRIRTSKKQWIWVYNIYNL